MSNVKKLMMTAAGGGGLNVEDVFSTYLYAGNNTARTITNGIDLDGEGGLVWIKSREHGYSHTLVDSERGTKDLRTDSSGAEQDSSQRVTSFNTDGFSLGTDNAVNYSSSDFASWTFRKAPKFFDVVTYTGNSTAGRTVSHNLGSVPGMIIIKNLDVAVPWAVYHRGMHPTPEDYYMNLNTNYARADNSSYWNDTAPTSTTITLGTANRVNALNSTYVAYIFAHNDGDGGFGPDGDKDIIKCGSYTGNGSSDGPEIDLGFEPQWFLTKRASSDADWHLVDNMREMSSSMRRVYPNNAYAEDYESDGMIPTATGIKFTGVQSQINASGQTYIYMAIRRGPMAVPESATDVFAIDTRGGTSPSPPELTSGFVTDFLIYPNNINTTNDKRVLDRLRGKEWLYTNKTNAETPVVGEWDYMDGHGDYSNVDSNDIGYMWKRAPNFFDVVCYTGNGTAGRTVSHNLGVAPEMIWVKVRDSSTWNWPVYVKYAGTGHLQLDNTQDYTASDYFNYSHPTDTVFYVSDQARTNLSGGSLIAYLFASLDGVSKVGSYTGNSTTASDVQNIDCGFSSGARFVLIKRTDSTGNWWFFDTERGITTGATDPVLSLDTATAEYTETAMFGRNVIQPYSSGFGVSSGAFNYSGYEYIFYAVA